MNENAKRPQETRDDAAEEVLSLQEKPAQEDDDVVAHGSTVSLAACAAQV